MLWYTCFPTTYIYIDWLIVFRKSFQSIGNLMSFLKSCHRFLYMKYPISYDKNMNNHKYSGLCWRTLAWVTLRCSEVTYTLGAWVLHSQITEMSSQKYFDTTAALTIYNIFHSNGAVNQPSMAYQCFEWSPRDFSHLPLTCIKTLKRTVYICKLEFHRLICGRGHMPLTGKIAKALLKRPEALLWCVEL